jgi:peptidoglycan/xylan/chitin deacetylase (PgdA/CDA1 family)
VYRRVRRRWHDSPARRAWQGVPYRIAAVRQCLDDPRLALTFDDGPGPYTSEVLDLLGSYGVVATFFVVGRNAEAAPGLVHRMLDEGHGVASHSLTHPWVPGLPWRRLLHEYRDGHRAVEDVAGQAIRLFRPPQGHLSLGGALAARATGAQTWLWSRGGDDWQAERRSAEVVRSLTPAVPGDVLLLHDAVATLDPGCHDRSEMIAGLREFLAVSTDNGWEFTRPDLAADSAEGRGRPRIEPRQLRSGGQ